MSTPDTLAAWTLAAMVEAELAAFALRRPRSAVERAAGVRFADLAAHVAGATEAARPVVRRLLRAGADVVLAHVFPQGATALAAQAAEQLVELGGQLAVRAQAALSEAVPAVRQTLVEAHRFGAGMVVAELGGQGADTRGWRVPTAPATVEQLALHIATHPLVRQLEVASRYVADPFRTLGMQVTRAELEAVLGATSEAGSVDVLHQGVQTVLGMGRLDVVEANGADRLARAWSSEILDPATCGPCAGVDGTAYTSLAAAKEDYPVGGGYRHCRGQSRCRGVLVFLLSSGPAPG